MKPQKALFLGGLPLAILTACNLTASGHSPTIAWDTLRGTPPTQTATSLVPDIPTPTPTPSTPTITPTPTENPLAIPRLEVGSAIDILRIEMLDTRNGWGIGGPRASGNSSHVFRTIDGGTAWVEVTPPEIASSASDLTSMAAIGFFPDSQTGWVTYHATLPGSVPSNPVIWKTTDGGRAWVSSSPLNTDGLMETYSVSHIVFSDSKSGWVLVHAGAGMNHDYIALYHSVDGGESWSRWIDPTSDGGIQSCSKTGLAFTDGSNGWLTGNCHGVRPGAFLFQTRDGGAHWDPVALPAPDGHPDLLTAFQYACGVRAPFLHNHQAFLGVECAEMDAADGVTVNYLYRASADGNPDSLPYPGGGIFTLDGKRIWALGKEIHRSENGGIDWTKISTVTWDGQFDFVTSQTGWAAVSKGSEYGLVQTVDGGGLWAQMAPVVAARP